MCQHAKPMKVSGDRSVRTLRSSQAPTTETVPYQVHIQPYVYVHYDACRKAASLGARWGWVALSVYLLATDSAVRLPGVFRANSYMY
jgi:hypothetical protein